MRGDFVPRRICVVGGAPAVARNAKPTELAAAVADREAAAESRKDAIAAVARAYGLPKRVVYDAVVTQKR